MRVMLLLATLSALLLASCATAPGPPPRAMPAPETAADVAPLVSTARADAKAAEVSPPSVP